MEEARQARFDAEEKERLDRVSHAREMAMARRIRTAYLTGDEKFILMRLMVVTLVLTKSYRKLLMLAKIFLLKVNII